MADSGLNDYVQHASRPNTSISMWRSSSISAGSGPMNPGNCGLGSPNLYNGERDRGVGDPSQGPSGVRGAARGDSLNGAANTDWLSGAAAHGDSSGAAHGDSLSRAAASAAHGYSSGAADGHSLSDAACSCTWDSLSGAAHGLAEWCRTWDSLSGATHGLAEWCRTWWLAVCCCCSRASRTSGHGGDNGMHGGTNGMWNAHGGVTGALAIIRTSTIR